MLGELSVLHIRHVGDGSTYEKCIGSLESFGGKN